LGLLVSSKTRRIVLRKDLLKQAVSLHKGTKKTAWDRERLVDAMSIVQTAVKIKRFGRASLNVGQS
jgi:hypothetical protein